VDFLKIDGFSRTWRRSDRPRMVEAINSVVISPASNIAEFVDSDRVIALLR